MEVDGSALNDESSKANSSISKTPKTKDAASDNKILYKVEECPPWSICIFLGFQVGRFNLFQVRCKLRNTSLKFNILLTCRILIEMYVNLIR